MTFSKITKTVVYPCSLLLIAFSFIACNKDRLTKETQTGANTFSCLVDGALFKPCKDKGINFVNHEPLSGGVTQTTTMVIPIAGVFADCYATDPRKSISISIGKFVGTGEYLTSDYPNVSCRYEYDNKVYSSELTGSGKVIITKDDRVKRILSGTFNFTAAAKSTTMTDIVSITSGRFDITY